ncbi:hypothetical protein Bca4012_082136 [Brassica carinata]
MAQQTLIYSFVARGTVILVDFTDFKGNFTSIAAQCLQKLPSSNNKVIYNCDGHTFNYLVENGFTMLFLAGVQGIIAYCVVAVDSAGREIPMAFLERVKEDFNKRYSGGKAATAQVNSLNKEFGSKLKEHIQYCMDHPDEISKLAKVKAQVSEVKGVLIENIGKVTERGEKIDILVDKTDYLRSEKTLNSQSSSLSRPPPAVKFGRRTSSGRTVSLSRDDDMDVPGDSSSQTDYINYTVHMPPTPDNQPAGSSGSTSDANRGGGPRSKMERRLSVMKSNNKSMLLRSQTGDFDHNRWLFESKGKYGIGNAFWSEEDDNYDGGVSMSDFFDKPWKPLTRKVQIPAKVLSPYRLLIVCRLVVLFFFLWWRIANPNEDAMWLWGLSIVCELWFAFSWILDILPKLNPINRATDLAALHDKFEQPSPSNPTGRSDLPGVDVFVSTADPDKEPPLVTANTILSILAVDYPIEKLSAYISDDGGAILTFEAMAEAVRFAEYWVPFCRKHDIEPRNPDSYFNLKKDPTKNKKKHDFVKDRRWVKREYDEFKVRINGLPEQIRKRAEQFNMREELKEKRIAKEKNGGVLPPDGVEVVKATWMADGTHWPGTWFEPKPDHSKGDHAGILQIMSKVPELEPVMGGPNEGALDFTGIDIRVPMFAYVSREKRPGFDHNKKAGAMNESVTFSFHKGLKELTHLIDMQITILSSLTVSNMRALDGLQGPVYVGTGCMFRRYALYGFNPPRANEYSGVFGQDKAPAMYARTQSGASQNSQTSDIESDTQPLTDDPDLGLPKKFGNSTVFTDTIPVAEYQGRPLADHMSVKNGRPPGALLLPRPPLDAPTVAEAIAVISCWYEDNTEWGDRIGWIYGSVTEDVVTGYRMHNRGWRSVYCITKRDAFRGTAPINLTDRLHQVLHDVTGGGGISV